MSGSPYAARPPRVFYDQTYRRISPVLYSAAFAIGLFGCVVQLA